MMEQLFSIIRDWLRDWKTKKGVAAYSFIILFFVLALLEIVKRSGFIVPPLWSIVAISFPLLVHFIIWAWAYYIYPVLVGKTKIAFSLNVQGEDPFLEEIKREFYSQLNSLNLTREVKVIELPHDKIIDTIEEAEKYSKKKDINLLVWGYVKRGQLEGQDVAECRLKFTYTYPTPSKKNIEELLQSDVKLAVTHRNWKIAVRNSIKDIDVIANNLMEISLFVIGLCLLLSRNTEKCLYVFDRLRACIGQSTPLIDRKRKSFVDRFDVIQIEALHLKATNLIQNLKIVESRGCLEKMLEINCNLPGAHINLAKIRYLEGNIGDAKYHTSRADKLAPDNPLCIINRAFFAILEENFEKSARLYRRLVKIRDWTMECNNLEVALFLEDEWNKCKYNLGLLFAAGFINFNFADKHRGRLQLRNFINKVTSQNKQREYSHLYILAEQTIKR